VLQFRSACNEESASNCEGQLPVHTKYLAARKHSKSVRINNRLSCYMSFHEEAYTSRCEGERKIICINVYHPQTKGKHSQFSNCRHRSLHYIERYKQPSHISPKMDYKQYNLTMSNEVWSIHVLLYSTNSVFVSLYCILGSFATYRCVLGYHFKVEGYVLLPCS
jgi:hypothetical protein